MRQIKLPCYLFFMSNMTPALVLVLPGRNRKKKRVSGEKTRKYKILCAGNNQHLQQV